MATFFSAALRKLFPANNTAWGETYPPRIIPPTLAVDGRTHALRILREYITGITFYVSAAPGLPPKPFQIKRENFLIEWPDQETDRVSPSVIIEPGSGEYETIGLTCFLEEDSRDVWGQGTVVQWQAEYVEKFVLEVQCAMRAERRAIAAGLEVAFMPTEQMSGIRFRMPAYYNELLWIGLNRRQNVDDEASARYRRRVRFDLEMRFNIVALVNYSPLTITEQVDTDVSTDTEQPVDLGPDADVIATG